MAGSPTSVIVTQIPTTTPISAFATANPSASRSGVVLHLAARNVRWDPTELHAPADKQFQIELRNEDTGELHNLLVANGSKPTALGRIFASGPAVPGPSTRTYDLPGIPPGRYVFWCAVHPEVMVGMLTVE